MGKEISSQTGGIGRCAGCLRRDQGPGLERRGNHLLFLLRAIFPLLPSSSVLAYWSAVLWLLERSLNNVDEKLE